MATFFMSHPVIVSSPDPDPRQWYFLIYPPCPDTAFLRSTRQAGIC